MVMEFVEIGGVRYPVAREETAKEREEVARERKLAQEREPTVEQRMEKCEEALLKLAGQLKEVRA